eukprot:129824-Prymnesium_polylepis.1
MGKFASARFGGAAYIYMSNLGSDLFRRASSSETRALYATISSTRASARRARASSARMRS